MGSHNFKGTADVVFRIFPWRSYNFQGKSDQCKHVSTLHVLYTLQRQAEEPPTGRCYSIRKWLFLLSCTLLQVSVGS